MICPNCKKEISEEDKFCGYCGLTLKKEKDINERIQLEKETPIVKTEEALDYAGFLIRLGAFVLDYGLILLFALLLGFFFYPFFSALPESFDSVVSIAIIVIYHTFFLSIFSSTPGKKLFGLRVVDENTKERTKITKAFTRSLSYIISSFIFGVGFWNIAFDKPKHQGWHDKIAKTLVIRDKKKNIVPGIIILIIFVIIYFFSDIGDDYLNQDWQQGQPFLEDILYQTEKESDTVGDYKKQTLEEQTSEKIESVIGEPLDSSLNEITLSIYFSNSIAKILCLEDYYSDYYFFGSGSIWWVNGRYWILTNDHVLEGMEKCIAVITKDWSEAAHDPLKAFQEDNIVVYNIDLETGFYSLIPGDDLAYAVLKTIPDINQPLTLLEDVALVPDIERCNEGYPIGTNIKIFGYPSIGSNTVITLTEGIISSFEKVDDTYYYLTSAKIGEGNSGGLAFTDVSENFSCVVGIPTFVLSGELESLGRILDITEEEIDYLLSDAIP